MQCNIYTGMKTRSAAALRVFYLCLVVYYIKPRVKSNDMLRPWMFGYTLPLISLVLADKYQIIKLRHCLLVCSRDSLILKLCKSCCVFWGFMFYVGLFDESAHLRINVHLCRYVNLRYLPQHVISDGGLGLCPRRSYMRFSVSSNFIRHLLYWCLSMSRNDIFQGSFLQVRRNVNNRMPRMYGVYIYIYIYVMCAGKWATTRWEH